MSNLEDILKQEMETFLPEAPNIWSAVKTDISAPDLTSNQLAGNLVGSKIGIIAIKTATVLLVVSSISILIYKNYNNEIKPNQPIVIEKINEEDKPLNEDKLFSETDKIKESAPAQKNIYIPKKSILKEEIPLVNSVTDVKEMQKNFNSNGNNENFNVMPDLPNIKTQIEKEENQIFDENIDMINTYEIVVNDNLHDSEETVEFLNPIENAFSPNNDGQNERFNIELRGESSYYLKIFNTKKELVFESHDKENVWDGKNQKSGMPCVEGTYFFELICKTKNLKKNFVKRGSIELLK